MRRSDFKMGFLIGLALGLLLGHSFVSAQEKKEFPMGTPVQTEALFCTTLESAKEVADAKGVVPDKLILERKCMPMRGVGIYEKEVYRNGDWAVYQLNGGNVTLWEATDYKGIPARKKGQVDT